MEARRSDDRCLSCGRDTASGTQLFSSRKRARDTRDGVDGYLCHACQPGSAQTVADQSVPLSGRYVIF